MSAHRESPMRWSRRRLLQAGVVAAGAGSALRATATPAELPPVDAPAAAMATRTDYWQAVRALYDVPDAPIHLEHGNWGMMARRIQQQYVAAIDRVNRQTAYFGRQLFADEQRQIMADLAQALGVGVDELVLVRNATEALTTLITGYNELRPGDAVLYADLDYPSMQGAMRWLAQQQRARLLTIDLPEPASHEAVLQRYSDTLRDNPDIRLLLLTHISHRTGLLLPVADIVALARSHGVDVILDSAHAWGQVDFTLPDTDADFVGLNLHKWMGAPLGLGLMYVRRERLPSISAHPVRGGGTLATAGIGARTGVGTSNLAAQLVIPDVLALHTQVGPSNKEARLRHLRNRWTGPLREDDRFDILTPDDASLYAGITSFRLRGQYTAEQNQALARRLLDEFGIFTVQRDGLASGSCVRVTPAVHTSEAEMDALVAALRVIVG